MSLIICVLYIAFGTFIYTSVFEALDAVDALYFTIVSRRRSREGQKRTAVGWRARQLLATIAARIVSTRAHSISPPRPRPHPHLPLSPSLPPGDLDDRGLWRHLPLVGRQQALHHCLLLHWRGADRRRVRGAASEAIALEPPPPPRPRTASTPLSPRTLVRVSHPHAAPSQPTRCLRST